MEGTLLLGIYVVDPVILLIEERIGRPPFSGRIRENPRGEQMISIPVAITQRRRPYDVPGRLGKALARPQVF
jgi:hypothetical protein